MRYIKCVCEQVNRFTFLYQIKFNRIDEHCVIRFTTLTIVAQSALIATLDQPFPLPLELRSHTLTVILITYRCRVNVGFTLAVTFVLKLLQWHSNKNLTHETKQYEL